MLYVLLTCLLSPESDARAALAMASADVTVKAEVEHHYRWVPCNNPDQAALFDGPPAPNGIQVGVWVYSESGFHYYDAAHDSWSYPQHRPPLAPLPPPKTRAAVPLAILSSGC